MTLSKTELTQLIKSKAKNLGFFDTGISKARQLKEQEPILRSWLKESMHGEMQYMENHYEKRLDPRKLVEGSKSVITVLQNYYPDREIPEENNYKISKYAYGEDYHILIKDKLMELLREIESVAGQVSARAFTDSAPIMDKVWAREGGLGWIGKNTCLINKKQGSFFFIGQVIINLELEYDEPFLADHCGTCDLCIKACPTGAIIKPFQLDARKCISYLTIEYRNAFPEGSAKQLQNWIFGCDICQDVCPWNKKAIAHKEERLRAPDELVRMRKPGWDNLSKDEFDKIFNTSAVSRVKYHDLMRNIQEVQ